MRRSRAAIFFALSVATATTACSSAPPTNATGDAGEVSKLTLTPIDATSVAPADADAKARGDAKGESAPPDPCGPEAGTYHFITEVISFDAGPCGGHNASMLPGVVEGPPQGGGDDTQSLSVVSLGDDGTIVVGFAPYAIENGPGVDFIVFSNPFEILGGDGARWTKPGEVSVSDDGTTWYTFPCTDTSSAEPDAGWESTECAGLQPVLSSTGNCVSPVNPAVSGGDLFDLSKVGLQTAKYVKIRSVIQGMACPDAGGSENGFNLDAISIVHPKML